MNASARTPVNLITGFLGTGKTTTILNLLKHRPEGEVWGVIVNEFGEIGIDGAVLSDRDSAEVREIAGGCLCCVTGPQLPVTIARLIREKRPARLLIEASGLAHASNLVDELRRAPLGDALDVQAVLAVVDPRQFVVLNYRQHPIYRDQVSVADVLLASKCQLVEAGVLDEFRRQAVAMYPAKAAIVEVGETMPLDSAVLDLPARPAGRFRLPKTTPDSGMANTGWTWPAETVFDADKVCALFDRLAAEVPALARAKAVLNLGSDHVWFNWVDGQWGAQTVAWRRDSRFELIAPEQDFAWLEAGLAACVLPA